MDYEQRSLICHKKSQGKIQLTSKVPVKTEEDLAIYYTPGVSAPCLAIQKNHNLAYDYTSKGNLVAVITDGSAILGLGNIGSLAGMPVMEGKSILFKNFANIDAFPICLAVQDPEKIIETIKNIAPGFAGINLEDIAAPHCFEIEKRLSKELDIPVFHDDQHGTAIVTCAAVLNSLKLTGKCISDIRIVINGAGAAGTAIAHMLHLLGAKTILVCDRQGILDRKENKILNKNKADLLNFCNPDNETGSLSDALIQADLFIGVSAPDVVTPVMVQSMKKNPILFAMANPKPEIHPDSAKEAGAAIIGTGRSDFPNQINNVLVFPGLFRGALDAKAKKITEGMLLAAVEALCSLIPESNLSEKNILPSVFDPRVVPAIASAVSAQWKKEQL